METHLHNYKIKKLLFSVEFYKFYCDSKRFVVLVQQIDKQEIDSIFSRKPLTSHTSLTTGMFLQMFCNTSDSGCRISIHFLMLHVHLHLANGVRCQDSRPASFEMSIGDLAFYSSGIS